MKQRDGKSENIKLKRTLIIQDYVGFLLNTIIAPMNRILNNLIYDYTAVTWCLIVINTLLR